MLVAFHQVIRIQLNSQLLPFSTSRTQHEDDILYNSYTIHRVLARALRPSLFDDFKRRLELCPNSPGRHLTMKLCGVDEPMRLLPFAHLLMAAAIHLIVYLSFQCRNIMNAPIPQYLMDSNMLNTYSDEKVKFVEVISASVGFMLIADTLLDMIIYFYISKAANSKADATHVQPWPSDVFLDNAKDWSIRILVAMSITIPPIVLLNTPLDGYFIQSAFGMKAIRNLSAVSAAMISITDCIDRTKLQFSFTFTMNIIYGLGELVYNFASLLERDASRTLILSIINPMRSVMYSLVSVRVIYHFFRIFRSLCKKNNELRLRRLSLKDWKFLLYTIFIVGSGVNLALSAPSNYAFYQYTTNQIISLQILYIIVMAVVASQLPLVVSRYEVATAQVLSDRFFLLDTVYNTLYICVYYIGLAWKVIGCLRGPLSDDKYLFGCHLLIIFDS